MQGMLGGSAQSAEPSAAVPAGDDGFQEDLARAIEVGSRCEVQGGKRGEVQYVGRCQGLPLGYWVGVKVRFQRTGAWGVFPGCGVQGPAPTQSP